MCLAPIMMDDGSAVACRKCKQCRGQAINDWVGRNIAESKTAKGAHSLTLTYGRNEANDSDHERAVLLTYSDIQKYLKLLRRHGYPVRYFIAGEFGSTKGRAHWHCILYWQDRVPEHVLRENFMERHWPHGWSFWDEIGPYSVRYACKYIQKDMGDALRQGHLTMSKKPPLGAKYFEQLAERYVEQGLSPQSLLYRFPEAKWRNKDGSEVPLDFMLRGRSAELFLQHYIDSWQAVHGDSRWPASEVVEDFVEYGEVRSRQAREGMPREPDTVGRTYEMLMDERRRKREALRNKLFRWQTPFDAQANERMRNGSREQ